MLIKKAPRLYSNLPDLDDHKTYAEINLSSLAENYRRLCKSADGTRHICVVKAGAYGHGTDACVKTLIGEGCDFFAVSCIEEAMYVRKACADCKNALADSIDILILGYTFPSQASLLSKYNIIQTVLSYDYAKELDSFAAAEKCKVRTHIAIDTGMNRIGFSATSEDEISRTIDEISTTSEMKNLRVEGMFTHFARADEENETLSDGHTRRQYERFDKVRRGLAEGGVDVGICHVCNSAAAVRFPEYKLDAVRFGIMLYGAEPSEFVKFPLLPVMKLKTVVTHIHTLTPGESVSYGGKFTSSEPKTIATLPIGYADGFLRAYSGAMVTVHTSAGDVRAPIVGRICMDQCMIDVTDLPVEVGNAVTLFGEDPSELSALAKMAGSIEYESLCLISARVPIVYTNS